MAWLEFHFIEFINEKMIGNLSKCFLQIKRCVVALWDENRKKSTISKKKKKNVRIKLNLLFFFPVDQSNPQWSPNPKKM